MAVETTHVGQQQEYHRIQQAIAIEKTWWGDQDLRFPSEAEAQEAQRAG